MITGRYVGDCQACAVTEVLLTISGGEKGHSPEPFRGSQPFKGLDNLTATPGFYSCKNFQLIHTCFITKNNRPATFNQKAISPIISMAKRLVRMLPMAILALAAPVDMALPSQPLGNLTWTGPIDSPTGLKRSFQGRDFASIERQIKDINPLFTWESIAPAAVIPSPPRTRYSVGFACNANGELEALRQLIEVGIDYLHGKPWDCGISPGTCTRVSYVRALNFPFQCI